MGKKKDYSGKWQGQYTYGVGYSERLRGRLEPFLLEIEVDRKGRFAGTVLEAERPGVGAVTGRVDGKIEDEEIEFVKIYSAYWGVLEDGTYYIDTAKAPVEVHYYGAVVGEGFGGTWKIFNSLVRRDGETEVWISEGTWSMGRG